MERSQQCQQEKSLAWFKLADLIARGEREKALSVFRLLAHSLSDRAYVLQLEGDILWYLDDKSAVERYKQAAFLYQKEKRWVDAIAIYEHLLTQSPESYEILATLLVFYAIIDWPEKFNERYTRLEQLFMGQSLDQSEMEKIFKDIIEVAKFADNKHEKVWLTDWLAQAIPLLPGELALRLQLLL
jgi:tetratricopeptide (TPR) repeat protein